MGEHSNKLQTAPCTLKSWAFCSHPCRIFSLLASPTKCVSLCQSFLLSLPAKSSLCSWVSGLLHVLQAPTLGQSCLIAYSLSWILQIQVQTYFVFTFTYPGSQQRCLSYLKTHSLFPVKDSCSFQSGEERGGGPGKIRPQKLLFFFFFGLTVVWEISQLACFCDLWSAGWERSQIISFCDLLALQKRAGCFMEFCGLRVL